MGDRYAQPKPKHQEEVRQTSFMVERSRMAGAMHAMADHRGFEQMKLAVEDELRRAAKSYGGKDGWIG